MLKAALLIAVMAAMPAAAQDKHKVAQGQFLTNQYGELCPTCEADITCTATDGAATAYHFHKRTFVSQMSTVLDYFPFTRSYGLKHTRPATTASVTEGRAAFDLTAKRIDLPDGTWIDRNNASWHAADGNPKGTCTEKNAP